MLEGAKLIGAGAATIALAGAIVGIGNVFSSFLNSVTVTRNPSLAKQLFGYAILGFALTEAIALFALMRAFFFCLNINPWVFTKFFLLCLFLFSFYTFLTREVKKKVFFFFLIHPKVRVVNDLIFLLFLIRAGVLIFEYVSSFSTALSMYPPGGEGGNAGPSSRPLFDLNAPPSPEPVQGPLISPQELEAQNEIRKQLLEQIEIKKALLRSWLDHLFRETILKETGIMPAPDVEISDFDEQFKQMMAMSQKEMKGTPEGEHRHLAKLLTQLTRENSTAAIKYRLENAVEKAVRLSLLEGRLNPDDFT